MRVCLSLFPRVVGLWSQGSWSLLLMNENGQKVWVDATEADD